RQMRNSTRMRRRGAAGESRDCEVKASPEEMHRTAFSAETRDKLRENSSRLYQDPPKSVRIFRIVCSVGLVLVEWNWIGNFVLDVVDLHVQVELIKRIHGRVVKFGN